MFVVVILNQLLDVACNVLDTAMEGIGTMKLGMGNILNVVISRANDNHISYGSFKTIGILYLHYKWCFFGAYSG